MMKVALVEDTHEDEAQFKAAFAAFSQENQLEAELRVFRTGNEFLRCPGGEFDLIFMDIELPDMNGIAISRELRKKDSHAVLVFLTKMGQFAINGYEVDAMDYILKPLDVGVFGVKMKKFIRRVVQNQQSDIPILFNGGKRIINSKNIIYVEVLKHNITYHTTEGCFFERGTLKEAETRLRNAFFVRLSHCYLVNLRNVAGIDKYDLTLDNGEILQISRSRKKEFCEAFNRFLGGTL